MAPRRTKEWTEIGTMPKYYVQLEGDDIGFDISETAEGIVVQSVTNDTEEEPRHVDFAPVHATPSSGEGLYSLLVDGLSYQLYVERTAQGYRLALRRHRFDLTVLSEREWRLQKVAPKQSLASGKLVVAAPMPGLVKSVLVEGGHEVVSGQRLVVLEAMKMENDIIAPREGRIATVHVQAGTVVEGGKPLITLE